MIFEWNRKYIFLSIYIHIYYPSALWDTEALSELRRLILPINCTVQSIHKRNLIKWTRNQVIFTIFRLIWNQTDVRLDPNQSENGKYNLISDWLIRFLYVYVAPEITQTTHFETHKKYSNFFLVNYPPQNGNVCLINQWYFIYVVLYIAFYIMFLALIRVKPTNHIFRLYSWYFFSVILYYLYVFP